VEGWPDHRILEFALFFAIPQGDVNDLAHALIEHFGSLAGVLDASVEELCKVKGVGSHTAIFLRMLPTVAQRYHRQHPAGSEGGAGSLFLRRPK
jgi:DNA repair protein RadC